MEIIIWREAVLTSKQQQEDVERKEWPGYITPRPLRRILEHWNDKWLYPDKYKHMAIVEQQY